MARVPHTPPEACRPRPSKACSVQASLDWAFFWDRWHLDERPAAPHRSSLG